MELIKSHLIKIYGKHTRRKNLIDVVDTFYSYSHEEVEQDGFTLMIKTIQEMDNYFIGLLREEVLLELNNLIENIQNGNPATLDRLQAICEDGKTLVYENETDNSIYVIYDNNGIVINHLTPDNLRVNMGDFILEVVSNEELEELIG